MVTENNTVYKRYTFLIFTSASSFIPRVDGQLV